MDPNGMVLTLPNQLPLCFEYHKGNNLPITTTISSDMVAVVSMAFDAFTSQDVSSSLIEEHYQNFSQAQIFFITMALEIRTLWISADSNIITFFKLAKSLDFDQIQGIFFMSYISLCFMKNSSFN